MIEPKQRLAIFITTPRGRAISIRHFQRQGTSRAHFAQAAGRIDYWSIDAERLEETDTTT